MYTSFSYFISFFYIKRTVTIFFDEPIFQSFIKPYSPFAISFANQWSFL